MKISFDQAIELEDLITVKSGEDYIHYQSVIKVLDILNIQNSFNWVNKKPCLSIEEESIFNEIEIKLLKKISHDIEYLLKDAANNYPIQQAEAIDILIGFKELQKLINSIDE